MNRPSLTRRTFIAEVTAAGAALALAPRSVAATTPAPEFRSTWQVMPDRPWAGAEFWANPMQDWRVAGGLVRHETLGVVAKAENAAVLRIDG